MPKQPTKLSRYQDATGELTNKKLQWGSWYVRHKLLLRRILVGFLLLVCVVFGGYSLYAWGRYLVFDYWNDQAQLQKLTGLGVQYRYWKDERGPQGLALAPVQVTPSTPGKYDIFALAENLNTDWVATVSYHFNFGAADTPTLKAVILPGTRQALVSLGNESEETISGANLILTDTKWQRLNPHTFANPVPYWQERVNFTVEDFVFSSADAASGVPTHAINFAVRNNSAYGYWQPLFTALFKDGDAVVGVKQIMIDIFRAGTRREISLTSLVPQLNITSVELIPVINVFNREVFIAPGL